MNTATATADSICPEAGSGTHLWMEGDTTATCHHCRADRAPATLTETKLRDMTPGQTVTFPTTYGGTHTGVLVRFDPRGPLAGPDAVIAVYRDSDGETVRVQTGLSYTGWVNAADEQDDDGGNEVRVITDGGELVSYTDHLDDEQAAWEDFTDAVRHLQDGEIAQLIVDDLIAAEHNHEYHGTVPLDVTEYA